MNYCKYLHVNFHDDENMKLRVIAAVVMLVRAEERLEVATFFMIWESSDSLLRSSPVLVTSKKAISCESSKTSSMPNCTQKAQAKTNSGL